MEPSLKEKITHIYFAEKWVTEEWFKIKSQPKEVRRKRTIMESDAQLARRLQEEEERAVAASFR